MKIYAIDIDRTLCLETCYTPEECLNATPNMKMVKKIKEIGLREHIVIYTARQDHLIPATLKWLRKHDIYHFGICNDKRPYTVYVDDKAMNVKEFLELEESS